MKWCSLLIAAITFCAALAVAQDAPAPDQFFSSDLIAWSGMQQPQAPEQPGQQTAPTHSGQAPSSPADQQQQQSDANSTDSRNTDSQNQAQTGSSFTGTISKEADGFVLKVSETTNYKLDAQRQVEQYEGQRVRVTGTLETGVNLIHVDRIEPLS
jgi:Protein of unknown function (DUF5818)